MEPGASEKIPTRGEQSPHARIGLRKCGSLRHPVEAIARSPVSISAVLAGFSVSSGKDGTPNQGLPNGAEAEEERLPISALLNRIRRLVPKTKTQHYDEIVRNFGVGALRPPPTPMSDGELARAIAEFLKDSPSAESVAALGRRLDPTSPL